MKNERIFPLERNNYFFGKLMTEREYDAEQLYFNNKRRLLNATLTGSGIVCGFTVTKVDGATIAVESGLALDGLGREMVIPQTVVTRLSELEGFADDRGMLPAVYLCAEYRETPVEPVRSMIGGGGETQFGYIRESARLFLRYGEPEPFEIAPPCVEDRDVNLEKILERGARELTYVAQIRLVRWENAYEIDGIVQVPFGQYCNAKAASDAPVQAVSEPSRRGLENDDRRLRNAPPAVAFGFADVAIPEGAKPGSTFFSDEIAHHLGLVPVTITLGLAVEGGAVFGDASIFGEAGEFGYAARARDGNGTFKIGVRVNARPRVRNLRFVWSAAANPARMDADAAETARILVKPSTSRIAPLGTVRLSADVYGLPDQDVVWSVKDPRGGDITRDGVYTAPAYPGVYVVVAETGGVSGTALIVVQ